MSQTNQTNINFPQLTQALREQRCILLLGPDVCCDFTKATPVPLSCKLAAKLSKSIKEFPLIDKSKLSHVVAGFEAFFAEKASGNIKNREYGRAECRKVITEFYEEHKKRQFSFYNKLADLPFHIIINTCHYDFFNKALIGEGKKVQGHYFNYKKPAHNSRLKFEPPTEDQPLVYNLFGRIDNTESLVLTEADHISFAENILQNTLPSNLQALFFRKKQYTFLFVGFDFREWHLRILLHLLFKDSYQKYTATALQKIDNINDFDHFLYEKHFLIDFDRIPPLGFLKRLKNELTPSPPPKKPKPQRGKRLFIMNNTHDDTLREDLNLMLKPLIRQQVVSEIQSSADIKPGSIVDKEMRRLIAEADIVVLIVTKNFLADDQLYDEYLPSLLERHNAEEARVIPVLMSSCLWKGTEVHLETMLPVNFDPVDIHANKNEVLKHIVNEIKINIENFEVI